MLLLLLELKILYLVKLIGKNILNIEMSIIVKKIKSLQIFSDGSFYFCNSNVFKKSKKLKFCDEDFKNSKFGDKKKVFLNNVISYDNFKYRYKFFKIN